MRNDQRAGRRGKVGAALALALVATLGAEQARAQTACLGSSGPDLVVAAFSGPANYDATGAYDALALGTTACNKGDAPASWIQGTNAHPVIGQNLYRLRSVDGSTRFEHIGRSWLKHGSTALSESLCCTCQSAGNQALGVGCSDPYSAQFNGFQNLLGPRWEVDAHTGVFSYPPSHPPYSGTTMRRLEVATADVEDTSTSTTRFFGEAQYVSRDDAAAGNGNNNCTYRGINAVPFQGSWLFGFTGTPFVEDPAIRAWKRADPEVIERDVQLENEGFLVLAQRVTELGNGRWHYEYALFNMNSDDGVGAFSVPIAPGTSVWNVGFHDLDYRGGDGIGSVDVDGTDWPHALADGALRFATTPFQVDPNANALRWGSTMNFRFDADVPPTDGEIVLGRQKSLLEERVPARVPSAPAPAGTAFCPGDGTQGACPCASGPSGHGCLHSFGQGALLAAYGDPLANDVRFVGSDLPPRATCVLLRGQGALAASAFGDGLACVASPLARAATGFADAAGTLLVPLDHGAGSGTFHYQLLFRNERSFCSPERFNLSNGVALDH